MAKKIITRQWLRMKADLDRAEKALRDVATGEIDELRGLKNYDGRGEENICLDDYETFDRVLWGDMGHGCHRKLKSVEDI